MKLIVNGEEREVREQKLGDVLRELSLNLSYAAVAVNWKCVPKSQLDQTEIKDGDRVEILVPQSGG